LIRAPLETARSAVAAKSFNGMFIGPSWTTSSKGLSDAASCAVGTTIEAVKVTSR
jgi:hypothetical protein